MVSLTDSANPQQQTPRTFLACLHFVPARQSPNELPGSEGQRVVGKGKLKWIHGLYTHIMM